jgi:energy-coupling factor transporter transmembrane protein EcfT
MTTETVLLLLMIILIVGLLPAWPYSRLWGYAPTGVLTVLLVIFIVWAVAGGRPLFRSSGQSLEDTVQEAGQDLKSAGRDVADSIRDTVK